MPQPRISVNALIQAGMSLGFGSRRVHPGMKPFLNGRRGRTHLIDLTESVKGLVRAWHFIRNLSAKDGCVLFVGGKLAARSPIREEAERCDTPFVDRRWTGGTLTNFSRLRRQLSRLNLLEAGEEKARSAKESARLNRERATLQRRFRGLRGMERTPDCIVVVDPRREAVAMSEAGKVGTAIVALIDTDGNPEPVDIPIPGNAASLKSIRIVLGYLADAILEGRRDKPSPPRPRDPGPGPEPAPVPARLRPRPTPGKARAARRPG